MHRKRLLQVARASLWVSPSEAPARSRTHSRPHPHCRAEALEALAPNRIPEPELAAGGRPNYWRPRAAFGEPPRHAPKVPLHLQERSSVLPPPCSPPPPSPPPRRSVPPPPTHPPAAPPIHSRPPAQPHSWRSAVRQQTSRGASTPQPTTTATRMSRIATSPPIHAIFHKSIARRTVHAESPNERPRVEAQLARVSAARGSDPIQSS
eukprot:6183337-Pleurochrysis_carterae.AAC.3